MIRSLLFLFSVCSLPALAQIHPALQSHNSFLSEILNKRWECSYNSYPALRFKENQIEVLSYEGKILRVLPNLIHVEPGIIRLPPNNFGHTEFFVFADDLQTFAIARMQDVYEFTVAGATAPVTLPASSADNPLNIEFKNHPLWKKGVAHFDKMELLDNTGAASSTNPAYVYLSRFQGVELPDKVTGATILSRKKPIGWYLTGYNIGTAVRTEKAGVFRAFLTSKFDEFIRRAAQFNYALLLAGYPEMASAQEKHSIRLVTNYFGESSAEVASCYKEMGQIHGYARSYAAAPALIEKGFHLLEPSS